MALIWGIQEYIALDANNITLVFDSGNIVNISGNIFLYPPQGHPILYNYYYWTSRLDQAPSQGTVNGDAVSEWSHCRWDVKHNQLTNQPT